MAGSDTPEPLAEALRRRAELRECMGGLEAALAAPATHQPEDWLVRVSGCLSEMRKDVEAHITLTEAPDGLYTDVLHAAPRLSGRVEKLRREHGEITSVLDAAVGVTAAGGPGAVDEVRTCGNALLVLLVRHRQRGADLLYEAYQADIGGDG